MINSINFLQIETYGTHSAIAHRLQTNYCLWCERKVKFFFTASTWEKKIKRFDNRWARVWFSHQKYIRNDGKCTTDLISMFVSPICCCLNWMCASRGCGTDTSAFDARRKQVYKRHAGKPLCAHRIRRNDFRGLAFVSSVLPRALFFQRIKYVWMKVIIFMKFKCVNCKNTPRKIHQR